MKYIIVTIIFSIILFGCSEQIKNQEIIQYSLQNTGDYQHKIYNIPMLSESELNSLSTNDGIVNYKYARQYAYTEFISNIELFYPQYEDDIINSLKSNSDPYITFTNRPAVVFDYNNNPKYYEFGILREETLIGTIVVSASPNEKEVIIERVYTQPLEYNSELFTYKRYIGKYPNVYYGYSADNLFENISLDSNNVKLIQISKAEWLINEENILNYYPQEELDSINEELIETSNISISQHINNLIDSQNIAKQWWLNVSNPNTYFLGTDSISNQFYLSNPQKEKILNEIENNEITNTLYLNEYQNNKILNTIWSGACGPTIMSWLYRGKFVSYHGFYIPLQGEYHPKTNKSVSKFNTYNYYRDPAYHNNEVYPISMNLDSGLYYQWYKRTLWAFGEKALYELGMSRGLREATDELYDIKSLIEKKSIKWMKEKHEPIVIVTSTKNGPHYIAAIGLGYIIKKNKKEKCYFYIFDNGYTTKSNNYKPCWIKSSAGLLYYGWNKKH